MQFSNNRECGVCKRVFSSSQHLFSHFETFPCNRQPSSFSSPAAAAPTTFRHYPNLNRNPNPTFHARNHSDHHYRWVYCDGQGMFHKGVPPPAMEYKWSLPKLSEMPATSSEDTRTLPLLYQLEQRRVEDNTVTGNGGANSSSIDLSLRL